MPASAFAKAAARADPTPPGGCFQCSPPMSSPTLRVAISQARCDASRLLILNPRNNAASLGPACPQHSSLQCSNLHSAPIGRGARLVKQLAQILLMLDRKPRV